MTDTYWNFPDGRGISWLSAFNLKMVRARTGALSDDRLPVLLLSSKKVPEHTAHASAFRTQMASFSPCRMLEITRYLGLNAWIRQPHQPCPGPSGKKAVDSGYKGKAAQFSQVTATIHLSRYLGYRHASWGGGRRSIELTTTYIGMYVLSRATEG